jgi:Tfp pilus assembly protein PilF
MYVNTLAAAYYRTGQYRAAIETLEPIRADAFSAFDLYFTAMACQQLGDPSKARRSFDRAIASHQAHGPHLSQSYREELRRFRAEAAELLEVSANDPMVDQ